MKKRNWLINLSIIGLLWFSLAFACKNGSGGSSSSRTTSYADDSAPSRSSQPTSSGAITEPEVNDYLLNECKKWERNYNCAVTIESFHAASPVKYGESMRAYPVTVDYKEIYEDYQRAKRITHHTGTTMNFARNVDTGKWEVISGEQGNETIEDQPAN